MTRYAIFLATCLLGACGGDAPAAVSAPAPPSPVAAPCAIASPAAFALVPTSEGAVLFFGTQDGVRALLVDPRGGELEPERVIARAQRPIELEAAASGRRAGVAWVVDHGEALEAWSAFSLDGGRSFSRPEELGPSVRGAPGARGRLGMGTLEAGRLSVQHRAPATACTGSPDRRCEPLYRHVLGEPDRARQRGDEPLEVEHPCEPLIGSTLFRDGTWYHAICHADPRPSATVYVIRNSISWASTFELEGCGAARLAPIDGGIVATARCADGVRAVAADEMGRTQLTLHDARAAARCEEGRPVLSLGDGATQVLLRLGEATDHLESLLPASMAPEGARAIWTGEALLVAAPSEGRVSLRRHACSGSELTGP